ncbi:MAG: DUF2202 domain-containing protein [Ignavibacteriales bacterium]|nr:DUF2202 domain-containing protein [Ignavibacteriales bacterium]
MKQTILSLPTEDLSEGEISGLLLMREEEKLARDVYITLYSKYGIKVFTNISRSEQTHTDAVKLLLDKYALTDPVQSDVVGVFTNQDLQSLYNQLIETGNITDVEALKVGAAIEEIDILDLLEQLNVVVDNQDLAYVYNNLNDGSENHLKAFVKNLSMRGVTYSPVYLDIETYNSIINN